jgi:hypothetical protein
MHRLFLGTLSASLGLLEEGYEIIGNETNGDGCRLSLSLFAA